MTPQIFFWVTFMESFENLFLPRPLGFRKKKGNGKENKRKNDRNMEKNLKIIENK